MSLRTTATVTPPTVSGKDNPSLLWFKCDDASDCSVLRDLWVTVLINNFARPRPLLNLWWVGAERNLSFAL